MLYDVEQINHLIRNRRTVKPEQMMNTPIPRTALSEILENAHWAPTHAHTEPWRFQVFIGEGRTRLGTFHAELYKSECETFLQRKYDKLLNRPNLASAVISLGMQRQEAKKLPEIEEIAAVACAVQNMMLSAFAQGIVSYWGSGGMTYHSGMKAFLGLQDDDRVLGLLHLGHPKGQLPEGRRLGRIDDKIKWVER